jgi:hypothetical protein
LLLLVSIALLAAVSCGDDEVATPQATNISPYKNLLNKDDVLANLDLAYNKRNFDQFEKLLDENFTFVFSEADYNEGTVDYPEWNRASELAANQKMLDPNLEGNKRVVSIELFLDDGGADWEPEPPNQDHPGETWYTKTVDYNFVAKTADDWEHRARGLQAMFYIRKDDSTGRWQIVLWRDDKGGLIALSPSAPAVEETTWGGIKALYHQ